MPQQKTTIVEVFQRGCSNFVCFSLFKYFIQITGQQTEQIELRGRNQRCAGTTAFWTRPQGELLFLGNGVQPWDGDLPRYTSKNIMNYYPSVSQRSKLETKQFIICGWFSSWTWGIPIAMWVYKRQANSLLVSMMFQFPQWIWSLQVLKESLAFLGSHSPLSTQEWENYRKLILRKNLGKLDTKNSYLAWIKGIWGEFPY